MATLSSCKPWWGFCGVCAGTLQISHHGKPLVYELQRELPRQAELIPSKERNAALDRRNPATQKRKATVPPPEQPWRKFQYGKLSPQPK